ncbi:MAG: cytochrome c [Verrucomicrobiales bacterium]|nr:cytochrome c [Verrucomicrobiales bacterium]
MNLRITTFVLACILPVIALSRELDLPATDIFSKGSNQYSDDILEITKGRGATIGWYIKAKQEDEVRVSIEYSCAAPLNQDYQLSFDGIDTFWKVTPTAEKEFSRAELGVFKIRPGLPVLVLLVPPSGTKYKHPVRFRKLIVAGSKPGNLSRLPASEGAKGPATPATSPGFGAKLSGLHPALSTLDLRDEALTLRVSGMKMRGENEILFTTWDGDLFSLDLTAVTETGPPPFRRIARGLSEPMGLAVSGPRIFVTEKNQVTELIDKDNDGMFETYRCVSQDWPCSMDYHEYLFGAVVKDDHLYFNASVGMARRGIDNYQPPLRGSVIKVHIDSGETEIFAGGLRTPDGIGLAADGGILVTDNQGEWLPANKLIHVEKGGFYQFRSIPPWHPLDVPKATPPAVWLPHGEIAASPTEPFVIPSNWGPYAGQVLFGDETFGGLQRAFLEKVDGVTQGAVFRFSQGFQHHFHRFAITPDGELYAGGIARGKDEEFIHRVSGLTRIRYTGNDVFEPLAARLYTNGLEIEFTLPLAEGTGWNPAAWHVTQWGYQATQTYGGQKVRHRRTGVRSATVSADRRRVFLELAEITPGEVIHVRLAQSLTSGNGLPLRTGDLWYTVNRIPANLPGEVKAAPPVTFAEPKSFFHYTKGDAGQILFQTYCTSCHSLDGTKLVGPSLQGLAGSHLRVIQPGSDKVLSVMATADYIRQSIMEPNALLAEGYPENIMPPMGGILTDKQIDALVNYLTKEPVTP